MQESKTKPLHKTVIYSSIPPNIHLVTIQTPNQEIVLIIMHQLLYPIMLVINKIIPLSRSLNASAGDKALVGEVLTVLEP